MRRDIGRGGRGRESSGGYGGGVVGVGLGEGDERIWCRNESSSDVVDTVVTVVIVVVTVVTV